MEIKKQKINVESAFQKAADKKVKAKRQNNGENFGMSEIRKHYFLPEYCIIAEERAKRPSDFISSAKLPEKKEPSNCIFCAGSEEKTPLATAVYKDEKIYSDTPEKRILKWDFRCFPNLYPALSSAQNPDYPEVQKINFQDFQKNGLQTKKESKFESEFRPKFEFKSRHGLRSNPGYGFHEVIVESPVHGKSPVNFSDHELKALMQVYKDRSCYYIAHDKIQYISLFKNSGKEAGASIAHSHSQLLALPFIPPLLERELEALKKEEECPYCTIIKEEKEDSRLIFENEECIAFTPYFSTGPFEVWILPKKHIDFLGACGENLLFALGEALRAVLNSYKKIFGEISFNYMFYQLYESPEFHLKLRILPRISIFAGFELNTGCYINSVSPERAASFLKGENTSDN